MRDENWAPKRMWSYPMRDQKLAPNQLGVHIMWFKWPHNSQLSVDHYSVPMGSCWAYYAHVVLPLVGEQHLMPKHYTTSTLTHSQTFLLRKLATQNRDHIVRIHLYQRNPRPPANNNAAWSSAHAWHNGLKSQTTAYVFTTTVAPPSLSSSALNKGVAVANWHRHLSTSDRDLGF